MKGLDFLRTFPIEQFKRMYKASTLEIKKKQSGERYFKCGNITGSVSSRYESDKPHAVSFVYSNEYQRYFFLLHNASGNMCEKAGSI